jgi:hypothetical protein
MLRGALYLIGNHISHDRCNYHPVPDLAYLSGAALKHLTTERACRLCKRADCPLLEVISKAWRWRTLLLDNLPASACDKRRDVSIKVLRVRDRARHGFRNLTSMVGS